MCIMNFLKTIACIAIFFSIPITAQEITNTKFGKGIFNVIAKDSSWSMKFATRIQMRYNSEWEEVDNKFINPQTNFLIRRARLKFDGFAFSPKLRYKIEFGFSNQDVSGASEFNRNTPRNILDAVIKWNFYENFELWAGQTKLPGNRERVISSGDMQFVDRSLLNSGFSIDRDIGFQLRHYINITDKFLIREIIAFSQGEGRNVTEGNVGGHQYTGRIELLPFGSFQGKGDYVGSDLVRENTPKVALGFTFDHNNNAVKTRSNMGSYMKNDVGLYQTNINTFFADAMFKYNGWSIMAEYANRNADDPFAKNSDDTLTGDTVETGKSLNIQAGYLFKNNIELATRFTNVNYDFRSDQKQYTLGFSKFISGHKLKVQTDINYLNVTGDSDRLMYRLQLDIHF